MALKAVRAGPEEEDKKTMAQARPSLPTFPLEAGWKERYDPETGKWVYVPLTLLDILYPPEDEAIVMPESPYHELWRRWLATMLEGFLRGWLILSDVYIHWWRQDIPPRAPDVAAIPGGQRPQPPEKAYWVGRDGPMPVFVVEITSEETRHIDLQEKPIFYAAVGVKELLVVDVWVPEGPWRLYGYRLEEEPYYREIEPDKEGGVTFETVGLRFVAVGRERIEVYDVKTGARLLTPEELQTYAEEQAAARAAAEARAEQEAAARAAAEARVAELEARLRELEARYSAQATPEPQEDAPDKEAE